MKPFEVAKGIYNVGVNDFNIRDFHGYSTEQGTSYNAFLIVDETVVLIDTVKKDFTDQMLENISQVIDPKRIDCVISNHTEMDHSGGLPRVMHYIGEEKPVYCSKMGKKNLSRHFTADLNYRPVENGEELNIGARSLTFLETRMLHWPDSMFTYEKSEKILFSSDAFGQHYAGYEMFDDVVGDAIMAHAKKYFANILLLYSPLIVKLVDQVTEMGLEINMICPDHGIIWRQDPGKIINAYVEWSKQQSGRKAIVVYDTMWNSTRVLAEAIAEGIADQGVFARPIHIRSAHRSDIMTEVLDAKALVFGSPTINNTMFPTLADVLTYIKGLRPKNKIGTAFGSYGWSGEAVGQIRGELEAMGVEIIDDGLRVAYVPDEKTKKSAFEFGQKIGKAVNEAV
ncbi:MAG: FprA family A-type flavoprotein [Thermodesulfobacteriota bacterium]